MLRRCTLPAVAVFLALGQVAGTHAQQPLPLDGVVRLLLRVEQVMQAGKALVIIAETNSTTSSQGTASIRRAPWRPRCVSSARFRSGRRTSQTPTP